jgi:hypothetical protein
VKERERESMTAFSSFHCVNELLDLDELYAAMNTLTELRIDHPRNVFDVPGAVSLLDELTRRRSPLQRLHLSRLFVAEPGDAPTEVGEAIARLLRTAHVTSLTFIDHSYNCGSDCALAIFSGLNEAPPLVELNLRGNYFRDDGLDLAYFVKRNPSLLSVDLSSCLIEYKTCEIMVALAAQPALERLHLRSARALDAHDAHGVVFFIDNCRAARELDITSGWFESNSLLASVFFALMENTTLLHFGVSVSSGKIDAHCTDAIVTCLANNTTLRSLALLSRSFTAVEDKRRFVHAVISNRNLLYINQIPRFEQEAPYRIALGRNLQAFLVGVAMVLLVGGLPPYVCADIIQRTKGFRAKDPHDIVDVVCRVQKSINSILARRLATV